jgi:hypothetical protein
VRRRRFITVMRPLGVNARIMIIFVNGESGDVAVNQFAISKSIG